MHQNKPPFLNNCPPPTVLSLLVQKPGGTVRGTAGGRRGILWGVGQKKIIIKENTKAFLRGGAEGGTVEGGHGSPIG